jgi:hypothetical protein
MPFLDHPKMKMNPSSEELAPSNMGQSVSESNNDISINRFTQEHLEEFASFFSVLEKIHRRLIAKGYRIIDGEIIPPTTKI